MKTETMTRKETRERPILFTGPMVRAILDGRKTQTRRAMKYQPTNEFCPRVGKFNRIMVDRNDQAYPGPDEWGASDENESYACPYGSPGDRLWVRETMRARHLLNLVTGEPTAAECGEYAADGAPVLSEDGFDFSWWYSRKTCPGIHAPRWASRITLEITGVRVKRVQDISRADIIAEGSPQPDGPQPAGAYHRWYRDLWDAINGPGSWDANPWVWVIEFRRIEE